MESNYYTPDIDEFYEGFEFEGLVSEPGHQSWSQVEFRLSDYQHVQDALGIHSYPNAYYDEVRVRCLDEDDLKELGFEYQHADKDGRTYNCYKLNKSVVVANIRPWYNECELYIHHYYNWDNAFTIYLSYRKDYRVVFDGVLKNKSELIKTLKAIGVIL